jgi:hypothetical protein
MIRKSGYRFSEKIMLNQKLGSARVSAPSRFSGRGEKIRHPNAIWHNFALDFPSH